MPYPVTFEADYAPRRNRLTASLRLILMIPVGISAYGYALAAYCAVSVAWFAIVFTGRYPRGLYGFVARFTRMLARTTAYTTLMCDVYPPFGGADDPSYPVRMHFAGPLPRYSRLRTLFRGLLVIPIGFLRYVITLLLEVIAFVAWVVIVLTGKLPRGLFEVLEFANSYIARSDAYILLLTETYPPFEGDQGRFVDIDPRPLAGSGSAV